MGCTCGGRGEWYVTMGITWIVAVLGSNSAHVNRP